MDPIVMAFLGLVSLVLTAALVRTRHLLAARDIGEERLRAFVGVTQTIVFEFDAEARYRHVWTEEPALLAAPPEKMLGRSINDVLGAETGAPFTAMVGRVLATGRPETFEYQIDLPGGRRWFLADLRPLRPARTASTRPAAATVVFVARDITRIKQAEEALRQSEANFRTLIENAPDGIMVHRAGMIVYANRAMAEIVGSTREALAGESTLDLIADADDRARALESRGLPVSGLLELRLRRRDDGIVPVEARQMQLSFDGCPSNVIIARDVSEKLAMRAKLALTERMAAVGTLAAGMAHEINNPLAFVSGNLEYALSALPEGELADALRDARTGADRIRDIVRDLGAYSRERPTCSSVDVVAAVDFAARMAQSAIKHRAQLVVDVAPLWIEGQESALGQVVLNLLINAAQAIGDGRALANEIRVTARAVRRDEVEISVADTGPGIDPAILPRVFDPFFTTKEVGEGSGLGLSVCHRLVTDMGGQISISSEPGRGTTVRFTLRRAAPAAQAAVDGAAATASGRRPRVIVVDDEPAIGRAIGRMLPDCDVSVTCRGSDALDLIGHGAPFDLILCDLMMPEMSGIELYDALEARGLAERIAFLTGGTFTERARSFLAEVKNPVLIKPCPAAQLRELVTRFAERPAAC